MQFITNNEKLLQYIPNVVAEVEGEATLFEKITPHVERAEQWFISNITTPAWIGAQQEKVTLNAYACAIIAAEAFRTAIPSLDVILTENGFGIVSNQTVVPASRDRINALIESLIETRDVTIEQLVIMLGGTGSKFAGLIFRGYEAQRMQGVTSHLYAKYLEQQPRIIVLQRNLAAEAVSINIMGQLVEVAYSDRDSMDVHKRYLIEQLTNIIVLQLEGKDAKKDIWRVVDYIRTRPSVFPDWAMSEAAEYWRDKTFKNDKKLGGYWL